MFRSLQFHRYDSVFDLGTAPPPPPGYDADWMSRHSSRPGTAGYDDDDDFFSDTSRDDEDDRLMDQAFGQMENAEEEVPIVSVVSVVPQTEEEEETGSQWSNPGMYSEERWDECYPATPWELMEEHLKLAELRVAIWDTDVAAACLLSGALGDRLPRPDASEVCPATSLYLPGLHAVQAAVPLAYVPFGQLLLVYSQFDLPAVLYSPLS